MYDGWLKLGGTELINAARTQAYVAHQLPSLQLGTAASKHEGLEVALGDGTYESPMIDDAPWVDLSDPSTFGFYGLYPLALEGFTGSTLERTVTQSIVDGGSTGSSRHATREMRVHGLLVARDELALEAGMTWLRSALAAEGCDPAGGADLCFFAAYPAIREGAVDSTAPLVSHFSYGPLTPETSPLTQRLPQTEGPAHARWFIEPRDGVSVTWGAMELAGPGVLETSGTAIVRRTNYVPWPSFEAGTEGWSVSGGADLSAPEEAGIHFGRVAEDTPPTLRYNWVADPGMVGEPVDAGWSSNALYGVEFVSLEDAPTPGMTVARIEVDPEFPEMWARLALLGPATAGEVTASFWAAQLTSPLTVSLLDVNGEPVASRTFEVTEPWQRYSITGPGVAGGALQFQVSANEGTVLYVDAPLVEDGAQAGEYFDGDFSDTPITVNLLPNPAGRQTSGTVATPDGVQPAVAGFATEPGVVAWQTAEDSYGARAVINGGGLGSSPLGSSPLGGAGVAMAGLGTAALGSAPLGSGTSDSTTGGYAVAVEWAPALAVTRPDRVTTPTTITTPAG